jgi:hypothetical protein
MRMIWLFLIIEIIVIRRPLGLILYALSPRLAGTRVLPPGSLEASIATGKYGSGLGASGFHHLATLRRSLPLQGRQLPFDIWVSPSDGVFALVLPNARSLMLVTYFGPRPAAVVSVDSVRTAFRKSGYWRESVLGSASRFFSRAISNSRVPSLRPNPRCQGGPI